MVSPHPAGWEEAAQRAEKEGGAGGRNLALAAQPRRWRRARRVAPTAASKVLSSSAARAASNQKVDWKCHKKKCQPPVSQQDVAVKLIPANINAAGAAGDWRGVLKWEGRMEELMAGQLDDSCSEILSAFSEAHRLGWLETGIKDHARSFVTLVERCIPFLGKLHLFRDQGEAMCNLSSILCFLERSSEAATWYQRARDVGAAHGFFSLEAKACRGLGTTASVAGRHEENEHALDGLILALFQARGIDEVEPLVLRYREAAKAQLEKEVVSFALLNSVFYSARLHDARGKPQEAAREVRALLDLMRENEAEVQVLAAPCQDMLGRARRHLKILDPEVGEEELIEAVAAALAKLRALSRSV